MQPDRATLDTLRELKVRLERRFGDRLAGLYLFGSRARGDHRPDSDADVAVILKGHLDHPFALTRQMIEDTYDLLLERGLYVEAWPLEEGSLEHPDAHPNSHLSRAVNQDRVAI